MKNTDFINEVKKQVGNGYWYGTYIGQVSSESLLAAKAKQYPSQYTNLYIKRSRRWLDGTNYSPPSGYSKTPNAPQGTPVADCVGLIKGIIWIADFGGKYQSASDLSANGMFSRCPKTGSIATIPEIPGLVVWKDNHIGVYIGNGIVIEARGVDHGIVETKLHERGWEKYGYCHLIDYVSPAINYEEIIKSLESQIKELQTSLTKEKTNNTALEKSYQASVEHIRVVEMELGQLQSMLTKEKSISSTLELRYKESVDHIQQTEIRLMTVQNELKSTQDKNSLLQEMIEEEQEKNESLSAEKNTLEQRVSDLETQLLEKPEIDWSSISLKDFVKECKKMIGE